ncbi:LytR/AlgR family response regulator transcription factor [Olivibacter sitiensis]|uniref:LytR/AlgR family response regulator transcription factor n=1 Tax=Olivibacter sitiensis TaxID=376470 RepID=UPI000421CFF5|nr:LytTR family DNA-binding domain-containing protein [Olivibacter sitiensis]
MRKPTLLLVDKDDLARKELREAMRSLSYTAIWECANGLEAIKYIDALQPDVVFMDIMLPGKSGFEVLKTVEHTPSVIFTSNSPEHAAQAFEYHAIDYLLKPLTFQRIQDALHKFEQRNRPFFEANSTGKAAHVYPSRILVEKSNRLVSVPVNQVTHLKADRDYTWIFTINKESYLSTNGIGQLEHKLDPKLFMRVHRSYIVNIDYIQELYRDISKLFVALPNDVEINIGRNYLPAVKELMF